MKSVFISFLVSNKYSVFYSIYFRNTKMGLCRNRCAYSTTHSSLINTSLTWARMVLGSFFLLYMWSHFGQCVTYCVLIFAVRLFSPNTLVQTDGAQGGDPNSRSRRGEEGNQAHKPRDDNELRVTQQLQSHTCCMCKISGIVKCQSLL